MQESIPKQEPRLQLFNLEGLIENLNLSLRNKEDVIELGEYKPREIKRNSLLYRLRGRKIEMGGIYPLTQRGDGRGMNGIFNYDSEIKIGRISLETGFVDLDEGDDCEVYELLELRLNSPVELANENEIPKCKIRLYRETCEWAEPSLEREDSVMYGFFPVRDDLSRFLPSIHF